MAGTAKVIVTANEAVKSRCLVVVRMFINSPNFKSLMDLTNDLSGGARDGNNPRAVFL
jgi:hypothetical protein